MLIIAFKGQVWMLFASLTSAWNETMKPERRQHRRCPIELDEIQVMVPGDPVTCTAKDISRKGVKIEYSPSAGKFIETEFIDILSKKYDLIYLSKIACETVYDIPTLMQNSYFKGGERRIRGMKFVSLTPEQEDRLEILINLCLKGSS